jgi:hypothetical protein
MSLLDERIAELFDTTAIAQVYACRECGAVVANGSQSQHYFWHEAQRPEREE